MNNNTIRTEAEKIFLAKLTVLTNQFKDLEDYCNANAIKQQETDMEISDYLHMLQHEQLSDSAKVIASSQITKLRKIREGLNNVAKLIHIYKSSSIGDTAQQTKMINDIRSTLGNLNQPYKYRVLTPAIVDKFKHYGEETHVAVKSDATESKPIKNKYNITKEDIENKLKSGMKNIEIAKEIGCSPAYLTHLKQKLGIATRPKHKKER